MDAKGTELKELFAKQDFCHFDDNRQNILEEKKKLARTFSEVENGIVVLTDYEKEVSHIYAGKLGECLGLGQTVIQESSVFEERIFRLIPSEELIERHILELRFIQFQKTLPIDESSCYNTISTLHFQVPEHGGCIPILHRTYYLERLPNGSIWLSLCIYTPFFDGVGTIYGIVNNRTGEMVCPETYERIDRKMLSAREATILSLLAKGQSSKQIADALHISVNTVYRHRQNILTALQVSNTASAVEVALRLRLISRWT